MHKSYKKSFQQNLISRLTGISGVHVTPYNDNGEINESLLRKIVDRISCAGIHTIVSAGNTAEFYSLSPNEIQKVQCLAAEENAGQRRAIFHTERNGCCRHSLFVDGRVQFFGLPYRVVLARD